MPRASGGADMTVPISSAILLASSAGLGGGGGANFSGSILGLDNEF